MPHYDKSVLQHKNHAVVALSFILHWYADDSVLLRLASMEKLINNDFFFKELCIVF